MNDIDHDVEEAFRLLAEKASADSNKNKESINIDEKSIGFRKGEQDLEHRQVMFFFMKELLSGSFKLLLDMIFLNFGGVFFHSLNIVKLPNNGMIFSEDFLKVFMAFVFCETLGVLAIIVKNLWRPPRSYGK